MLFYIQSRRRHKTYVNDLKTVEIKSGDLILDENNKDITQEIIQGQKTIYVKKDDEDKLYTDYKNKYFFIFSPDYNTKLSDESSKVSEIPFEKEVKDDKTKTKDKDKDKDKKYVFDDKLEGTKYTEKHYSEIYDFLIKYRTETPDDVKNISYFEEIVYAIGKHKHNTDNILEIDMHKRFINRIVAIQKKNKNEE